jgi:CheY-like chemotaxis protein
VFTCFLIDDDLDDQEIFNFVLRQIDKTAKCIFANDGIYALEKIKTDESFVPNFIFIDINMPRMNGIECLAEIKKIKRLQKVPVYMYSTFAGKAIVEECKKLGATGFIKKHVDTEDLKKDIVRITSYYNTN